MKESLLQENQWNSVSIGGNKNRFGYNITTTAVSSSWYNQQLDNSGSRLSRLRRYHDADCCSVEISRALDILAQDISSSNADDEPTFFLHVPEEFKVKKTSLDLYQSMLKTWGKRTEMEEKFFDRVRDTLKYGAQFWKKEPDGSLKKLYTERFIGYIVSDHDEDWVTHYIYDPNAPRIEDNRGTNYRTTIRKSNSEKPYPIPVDQLLIMKLGDKPFGESVIERVYSTYRQLQMLETAMVIYRVVRAPERRIYYIDTGNLQGHKREAAIERQRLRLMQKQATKSNGDLTTEYDPHSTSEDIFIPTNSQGKGSRVETLAGGQSLGETRDLAWFYKKLAAGLRIPSSMIDVQMEDNQGSQFSDMRVGQVYQVEIRYMGHVKRIARYFQAVMDKHFKDFCLDREVSVPDEIEVWITPPSSFAEYRDIEVNQAQLNVYNSTTMIDQMSKKFAMMKYLGLSQEEIKQNESLILQQKGMSVKDLSGVPEYIVDNLIYGDGTIATQYLQELVVRAQAEEQGKDPDQAVDQMMTQQAIAPEDGQEQ